MARIKRRRYKRTYRRKSYGRKRNYRRRASYKRRAVRGSRGRFVRPRRAPPTTGLRSRLSLRARSVVTKSSEIKAHTTLDIIKHAASYGTTATLCNVMIGVAAGADGRTAKTTTIMQHQMTIHLHVPTPQLASKVQIRFYVVRRMTNYTSEVPVLSDASPTPDTDPNQLFQNNGWYTLRNDNSRKPWRIVKQGTVELGWIDGIFMRQSAYINIKLKPYRINWEDYAGTGVASMRTGAHFLFIRYFDLIGAATGTGVPEWSADEKVWFNPAG